MELTEDQLAVILEACIEFSVQLLQQDGGFLPFGARVKADGEIQFARLTRENEESLDDLYRRTAAALAEDAASGTIVGAALVAHFGLPSGTAGDSDSVIAIHVETAGFSRSIVVPYRLDGSTPVVELDKMTPQAVAPVIFTG